MKLTVCGKQIFVDDALYTGFQYVTGISENIERLPKDTSEEDIQAFRGSHLRDCISQFLNIPVEELGTLSEQELTDYALVTMRKVMDNYRIMESGGEITTEWSEGRDFGG